MSLTESGVSLLPQFRRQPPTCRLCLPVGSSVLEHIFLPCRTDGDDGRSIGVIEAVRRVLSEAADQRPHPVRQGSPPAWLRSQFHADGGSIGETPAQAEQTFG